MYRLFNRMSNKMSEDYFWKKIDENCSQVATGLKVKLFLHIGVANKDSTILTKNIKLLSELPEHSSS